jgi:hypothetical protein
MNAPQLAIVCALIVLNACLPGSLMARADDTSDAPAGAVEQRTERGPVSALVRVEPDTVRIGDPVTLTVEVTAEAGVELLMPVFGASLERFTILEFVPRERIDEAGRTVSSQRYRLQPPASGQQAIPPITVEFVDRRPGQRPAPEDEDAFELLTERVAFTVESVVPEGAGGELKPPLGPLEAVADERASGWPWVATGVGLVMAATMLVVIGRLRGRAHRRSAYEIALERLEALEGRPRPDADAMDGFFVELSDIVRRYLEDRFELHAPELTTEEFLDVAAGSPDLTRNHRGFLRTFLSSADRVKFARHVPQPSEVETALSAVRGFLQQTSGTESPAVSPSAPNAREEAHA